MRIALIDHSYHKTTKSTLFISEILEKVGSVHRIFDESWCRGKNEWRENFNESDYDLIAVCQTYEAFSALSGRHDNVVFIPMYDAMLVRGRFYWKKEFAAAKCLCFSRTLHEEISRRGGLSRAFRFFPDPSQFGTVSDFETIRAFFWYRRKDIGPEAIFEMCRNVRVAQFTLHDAPDPGEIPPKIRRVPSNISGFEITQWLENGEDFRQTLLKHNVYFASRMSEGIGMGFLEAMASGLCVVAPNAPTMNEYIDSGTNGLLYAPGRSGPVNFSSIREMSMRGRETVERGFQDWQKSQAEIIDFLATPMSRLTAREDSRQGSPTASSSSPSA